MAVLVWLSHGCRQVFRRSSGCSYSTDSMAVSDRPSEATSDVEITLATIRRHDWFYFPDGNVVFMVSFSVT